MRPLFLDIALRHHFNVLVDRLHSSLMAAKAPVQVGDAVAAPAHAPHLPPGLAPPVMPPLDVPPAVSLPRPAFVFDQGKGKTVVPRDDAKAKTEKFVDYKAAISDHTMRLEDLAVRVGNLEKKPVEKPAEKPVSKEEGPELLDSEARPVRLSTEGRRADLPATTVYTVVVLLAVVFGAMVFAWFSTRERSGSAVLAFLWHRQVCGSWWVRPTYYCSMVYHPGRIAFAVAICVALVVRLALTTVSRHVTVTVDPYMEIDSIGIAMDRGSPMPLYKCALSRARVCYEYRILNWALWHSAQFQAVVLHYAVQTLLNNNRLFASAAATELVAQIIRGCTTFRPGSRVLTENPLVLEDTHTLLKWIVAITDMQRVNSAPPVNLVSPGVMKLM